MNTTCINLSKTKASQVSFESLKKHWLFIFCVLLWIVFLWQHEKILMFIESERISLEGLFNAGFDWCAIQTGFLFSVFVYTHSKSNKFIVAVSGTPAMKKFQSDLIRVIKLGFATLIPALLGLIFPFQLQSFGVFSYMCISLWVSLFTYTFSTFVVVVYTFNTMIKIPDDKDKLAH